MIDILANGLAAGLRRDGYAPHIIGAAVAWLRTTNEQKLEAAFDEQRGILMVLPVTPSEVAVYPRLVRRDELKHVQRTALVLGLDIERLWGNLHKWAINKMAELN